MMNNLSQLSSWDGTVVAESGPLMCLSSRKLTQSLDNQITKGAGDKLHFIWMTELNLTEFASFFFPLTDKDCKCQFMAVKGLQMHRLKTGILQHQCLIPVTTMQRGAKLPLIIDWFFFKVQIYVQTWIVCSKTMWGFFLPCRTLVTI